MKWTKWICVVGCASCLPAAALAQSPSARPGATWGFPTYSSPAYPYRANPGVPYGYPAYPSAPYGYGVAPGIPYVTPAYSSASYARPAGCCSYGVPTAPPANSYGPPPGVPQGSPPVAAVPMAPGGTPAPVDAPADSELCPAPDEIHAPAPPGPPCVLMAPPMIGGGSIGGTGTGLLTVQSVLSDSTIANYATTTDRAELRVPLLSRGPYRIADDESPRPTDRVYFDYNFYSNVPVVLGTPTSTLTLSPQLAAISRFGPGPFPLRQTLTSTVTAPTAPPGSPATLSPLTTLTDIRTRSLDVSGETFGLEKTVGDDFSIGLRMPLIQTQHPADAAVNPQRALAFESPAVSNMGVVTAVDDGLDASQFGDLSLVLKYAVVNDAATGNAVSTGLVVTLPTGPDFLPADGSSPFNPVLFQPWVGGVYNADRWYAQGFVSVVVPTDFRDAVVLFNDFGVGCRVYRASSDACWLTGITPTAEVHVNTPLTRAGLDARPVGEADLADLTGGVHVDFGGARLTAGAVAPLTGPRLFDFEVVARLNWDF